MARRYYSSTAVATTLSGNINNSTTSITVTALSGYPAQFPYTAIIDPDTASEEVVTVTGASGTTLTVTRGSDGTSAVSHNAGAVFRHGVSARDFDEANAFANGGGVANALVNAKGDLITATANDTPAILTAGSNGQMLMADSSATAGLRYVDPPASRNMVVNGSMQVAQRSTSVTGISSGTGVYRTADRYYTNVVSQGTWTQTVENDAPTGSGLRKSLKMACTSATTSPSAGARVDISTVLEGQDIQRIRKGTSSAEQLTLSFWVKGNVTGTYIVSLFDNDNTRHVSASYTISQSATWERKTITFPADTTGAFDNDNGASLYLTWFLGVGSTLSSGTLATTWASLVEADRAVGQTNLAAATNNYWQVTGVQLETGPVATPFEFEPFEATLRKCQRYYTVLSNNIFEPLAIGANYAADYLIFSIHLPTTMRTAPSIAAASGTNYYTFDRNGASDLFNSVTINASTVNNVTLFNSTEISGTAGHAGIVKTNNAAASIAASAEL